MCCERVQEYRSHQEEIKTDVIISVPENNKMSHSNRDGMTGWNHININSSLTTQEQQRSRYRVIVYLHYHPLSKIGLHLNNRKLTVSGSTHSFFYARYMQNACSFKMNLTLNNKNASHKSYNFAVHDMLMYLFKA